MINFEKLFQENQGFIFRYLMKLCGNESLAEELTQETFYQAIRTIDRFDGSCQLSTWLCSITKNVHHTWQRKYPEYGILEEYTKTYDSTEENLLQAMERVEMIKSCIRVRN